MNATGTALQGKHTVEASELYMAFELVRRIGSYRWATARAARAAIRWWRGTRGCSSASTRPRCVAGLRRRREWVAVMMPGVMASGRATGSSSTVMPQQHLRRVDVIQAVRSKPKPRVSGVMLANSDSDRARIVAESKAAVKKGPHEAAQ